MSFILGFVIVIILIILFGLSVIGNIVRTIFGIPRTNSSGSTRTRTQSSTQTSKDSYTDSHSKDRKKVFDKDDGEYVEFEEIKDDK